MGLAGMGLAGKGLAGKEEDRQVWFGCDRWLSGHPPESMRRVLERLAALPAASGRGDVYGEGGPVTELEERVADLVGKPAARFALKGVIAQQAALRAWVDTRRVSTVALHPASHLDADEAGAFQTLHPLRALRIGDTRPFTVSDLDALGEPVGVVTVELPLRRSGFLLPTWDELVAISTWCQEREVPLHIDGARLWEAAAGYDRPLAEIAALADSVYVSLYKGLGGLAGCVLAGDSDFLERAGPWLTRHGAAAFAMYPYALAALAGLDRHLPGMSAYRDGAVRLAAALAEVPDLHVTPNPPATNGFQVYLPGRAEQLRAAHLELARETGVWLFGRFVDSAIQGMAIVEVQTGEAADALRDDEVVALVKRLIEEA